MLGVSILHGRGSFYEVEGEKVHYITDERDYKLHQGFGIAGVTGRGTLQFFEEGDLTGSDMVQQTSAIILLDMPNSGTLSI